MSLESRYNNLSDEAKEKARACRTPEEILVLAKEEGFELSDEELEGIAGGSSWLEKCACDGRGFCSTNTRPCDS